MKHEHCKFSGWSSTSSWKDDRHYWYAASTIIPTQNSGQKIGTVWRPWLNLAPRTNTAIIVVGGDFILPGSEMDGIGPPRCRRQEPLAHNFTTSSWMTSRTWNSSRWYRNPQEETINFLDLPHQRPKLGPKDWSAPGALWSWHSLHGVAHPAPKEAPAIVTNTPLHGRMWITSEESGKSNEEQHHVQHLQWGQQTWRGLDGTRQWPDPNPLGTCSP